MKLALIGSAPSSVGLAPYKDASYQQYAAGKVDIHPAAPYKDESWEIWACSPGAYGVVQRATRWFEVHRWEPAQSWFSPEYCQWLRVFNGPVYTGHPVPEIKNHVVYPLEEIEQEFSSYFLTSSLALMLALAIKECEASGDKENVIGLWGVDMSATEEHGYQRAGCQHLILEALRRGISVYVPPESDLLRPMPVYGISEWDHNFIKSTARMRELIGRKQQADQQVASANANATFLTGAIDDLNYHINTWTSPYGLEAGKVICLKPKKKGL